MSQYRACNPLLITTNYDNTETNDNDTCTGDLVFGAITSSEIDAPNHVFNAGVIPSANTGGSVLFDASSNRQMDTADSWGINFKTQSAPIINDLRIRRIVIDLQPNGSSVSGVRFNLAASPPLLSSGAFIGSTTCGAPQPDTVVFDGSPLAISTSLTTTTYSNDDIAFSWGSAAPDVLTIDFPVALDPMNPDLNAFLPGERFRFGASVEGGTGPPADGDRIGSESTKVSVFFSNLAGDLPGAPSEDNFVDSDLRNNFSTVPDLDPCVSTNRPFVLPNSPASGNGNDDQSFVLLDATGGGDPFAGRAKTRVSVPSVCMNLFGLRPGGFEVQAETFAFYDPNTRRPSLIRISNFVCP